MKKTIAFLLAAVLLLSMLPMASAAAGMDNFQKSQTYTAGQFVDVASSAWYAGGVQSAYELGLMKGSSNAAFNPTGNLTVAEALAIACRLHSIYEDNGQTFTQGSPWYQVYVDYAVANGIMSAGQLDPTKTITREQFAFLMCGAIPFADLNAINNVTTVPDVRQTSTYGGFVYRLYNAGVLTGSDKYGTFKPTTAIQRSEVATIVTRMADKSQRKTFTLEEKPPEVTGIQLAGRTTCVIGGTVQWTATPIPANAVTTFTWTVGNPGVATVDQNGKITGIKEGQCNITVTAANGVKKTVLATVAQGGTLQNPYEADGNVLINDNYLNFSSDPIWTVKLKLDNVITGEEANRIAHEESRLNDEKIDENHEWRLFEFTLTFVSSSKGANDEMQVYKLIDYTDFYTLSGAKAGSCSTIGKKIYSTYSPAVVHLYPGASSKVIIIVGVPKNSGDLLMRFACGDDKTWVRLGTSANGPSVLSGSNTPTDNTTGSTTGSTSNTGKATFSTIAQVVNDYISKNTLGMGTYYDIYNDYSSGFDINMYVQTGKDENGDYIDLRYTLKNVEKDHFDGKIIIRSESKNEFGYEWTGMYSNTNGTNPFMVFHATIDPASYDGSGVNGVEISIEEGKYTIQDSNARASILKTNLTTLLLLLSEFNDKVLGPAGYSISDMGFTKLS